MSGLEKADFWVGGKSLVQTLGNEVKSESLCEQTAAPESRVVVSSSSVLYSSLL